MSLENTIQQNKAKFVHLNVRSKYSILEGLCDIKKVLAKCKEYSMPAVAITDTDNFFCGVDFSLSAPGEGIQPIIGQSVPITNEELNKNLQMQPPFHVQVLVQNEEGYKNFIKLISHIHLDSKEKGFNHPQTSFDTLAKYNKGLILLTGSAEQGPLAYHLHKHKYEKAKEYLSKLKDIFGDRVYVEIQRHGTDLEKKIEPDLIKLACELEVPLVATNEARFMSKDQAFGLEVMMAIHDSKVIAESGRRKYSKEYYFKSQEEMIELFKDLPEATENTIKIAQRCGFKVPTGTAYMPRWTDESGLDEAAVMEKISREGFEEKLNHFVLPFCKTEEEKEAKRKEYTERLEFELDIINKMGFPGYFIIVSDFCKWSKQNGVAVGPGRGSGAGSLVAWCMDITGVDPIRYGLFFERFLNPERVSLPDFDIDFCQENRHKTIEYVQRFYGSDKVCVITTYGTLKAKGCIRDVGRVLGLNYGQVSRIAALVPDDAKTIAKAIEGEQLLKDMYESDEDIKELLDISMQIEGAKRHTSVHAAGVIIAPDKLTNLAPLYQDPRLDLPGTQFDTKYVETAGLVKFDFLGLKTLTTIKFTLDLIHESGIELDIDKIPLDDTPTYDLLCRADSVGVFQVESAGMQDLLKKLQPRNIEHLSAQVALYRPGPLESGMLDDFVECRHGRQEPKYPHPSLEEILKETFGVIVYQEQVMQIAQVYSGYTLGGADLLRRAMGKKKPEEMAKQTAVFVKGAKETLNIPEEDSKALFNLIEKFAGYGFNKAHSLSYALISYQTAYLKTHYRHEFIAATMTLDRGNPDKLVKLKEDLDFGKIELLPPCINHSTDRFEVEQDKDGSKKVRFAINAIKGSGDEAARLIAKERKENGDFKDIFDVMERLNPSCMNKRLFEVLTCSGAFDCFGHERAFLLANMETLLQYMNESSQEKNSAQMSLFAENTNILERPSLRDAEPLDPIEQLELEEKALGFFLSSHPLKAYEKELSKLGPDLTDIKDIKEKATKSSKANIIIAGSIADLQERKTSSGDRMAIVKISDLTGIQEVAIFPKQYSQAKSILEEKQPVAINIRARISEDKLSVQANSIESLDKDIMSLASITFKLGDPNSTAELSELITNQPNGGTACFINYELDNIGMVVFKLHKYIKTNRRFIHKVNSIKDVDILQ